MANLTSTTFNGNSLNVTGGIHQMGGGCTPWMRLWHCADCPVNDCSPTYSAPYLHVRTPISLAGYYSPFMFEISSFHTYSGEYTLDSKTIISSQYNYILHSKTFVKNGNISNVNMPYFYISDLVYGASKRMCFSINKVGCCCVGWLWVRWWGDTSITSQFDSYAWATRGGTNFYNVQADPNSAFSPYF